MAHKENKGGVLTNEQIEQDLKVSGRDIQEGHYHGSQDTGDSKPGDLYINNKEDKEQDNGENKK